jgi:glycosyltransferase involved in cell wall biosynthesis
LKVLIVTTGYPRDDADPSGIFIKRLAMAMARSGARVTILAPGDKDAKFREMDNGIYIIRFFYAPRILMRIGYGEGGIPENVRRWPWLLLILPFFLFSLAIYTITLAKDYDVIHANWLATGFFSLPAKWIKKKPLVVTLRGTDLNGVASRLLPFVAVGADAITTVNRIWAEHLRMRFSGKVFYTPNGVEVSNAPLDLRTKLGIGSDEIIALYVGTLRKVKGADVLAQAAKITMGLDCSVRFLVIGPGNPKRLGLTELSNVICAGGISPNEALAVYPCCDIFVLPSRSEGRPNALLEAMASGLPAVATNLPGVLEILSGDSGIIVETEDPEAIAQAVCDLARDPVRRRGMGERAKARISELSLDWESSARNYLRAFAEVC